MPVATLTVRRCANCGHTLAASNKGTTCYRPCKALVETSIPKSAVEVEEVLRAAETHFDQSRKEIFVKQNDGPLAHRRKVIIYLLEMDARLPDHKVSALVNRDNSSVQSAFHSVEKKMDLFADDIIAVRKLYPYCKVG